MGVFITCSSVSVAKASGGLFSSLAAAAAAAELTAGIDLLARLARDRLGAVGDEALPAPFSASRFHLDDATKPPLTNHV